MSGDLVILASVTQLGGLAGWISLMAVLVLAGGYVSHRRHVQQLRRWAGRAPERSQQLQRRAPERAHAGHSQTTAPVRRGRMVAPLVSVFLIGAAGAVALVLALSHGQSAGDEPPPAATVAVVNTTDVDGLGARMAVKLSRAGFPRDRVTTAWPELSVTVVQYRPGHRAAAQRAAQLIRARAVQRLTPSTRRLVGPRAQIAVLVGTDHGN